MDWLIEIGKGTIKLFLNPLLYWGIILFLTVGFRRIKKERKQFGQKVFGVFAESSGTWGFSIIVGLFVSVLMAGFGILFSYQMLIVLIVMTILLSFVKQGTLLSPSYTLGFTYILLLFLPALIRYQTIIDIDFQPTAAGIYSGIAILLGILLMSEAQVLARIKTNESFPTRVLGNRGKWIGRHQLKRLSMIPLFFLVPSGLITPFASFWPMFSIGEHTYSLVLFPFLLGFNHIVKGNHPIVVQGKLVRSMVFLGFVVAIIGVGSVYMTWLSLVSVVLAILGREYICYRVRVHDKRNIPYFQSTSKGVQVLAVIPGTPAERLSIFVGEIIRKVNDVSVLTEMEFYQALQTSGAHVKLDIVNLDGESRIIQGPLYQDEHYELGLIFTERQSYEDTSYVS